MGTRYRRAPGMCDLGSFGISLEASHQELCEETTPKFDMCPVCACATALLEPPHCAAGSRVMLQFCYTEIKWGLYEQQSTLRIVGPYLGWT